MSGCHECQCISHPLPPCGPCENCKHGWDQIIDCDNDCQDCDIDHSEDGERKMTEDNGLPCKIDSTELSKGQLVALWVDRDGDLISMVGKVYGIKRNDDGTPKAVKILPHNDSLLATWELGDDSEGTIVLLRGAVHELPTQDDSPILVHAFSDPHDWPHGVPAVAIKVTGHGWHVIAGDISGFVDAHQITKWSRLVEADQ